MCIDWNILPLKNKLLGAFWWPNDATIFCPAVLCYLELYAIPVHL